MDSYFRCREGNETNFASANNESYFDYRQIMKPILLAQKALVR
jgi:hypothetical protein